jgi:FAD/FMN-containing dehydrogenase
MLEIAGTVDDGVMVAEPDLQQLDGRLGGAVLRPHDPGWHEAIRLWNGMMSPEPALVVQPASTADVVAAVDFAREHALRLSVKGGGHHIAGISIADGGVMLDMSRMNAVEVDPESRRAHVGPGCRLGDVDRATQPHGLATVLGFISKTGVAGLVLGGGFGYLARRFGWAVDNLEEVEIVTADGTVRTANRQQNQDLFWAVRGAGANFGVAVSLTFRLHQVGPTVVGGLVAYPFAKAAEVLRYYGEFVRELPDELTMGAGVLHAPDGSGTKLVALLAGWCGPVADGVEAVRPLKELGDVAMDALGPIPYNDLNKMLDAGFPKGALNYWKSTFVPEVSDGAVDAVVDAFAACPVPMSGMLFERWHGAMQRVPADATAYGLRDHGHNLLVLAEWLDPKQTPAGVAWARESFAALESHRAPGNYVNYLGDDASAADVAAAYGPSYARLAELKAEYDPENVFHRNQNIPPMKRSRPRAE